MTGISKEITIAFAVLLSASSLLPASELTQDLRDLRQLTAWRSSKMDTPAEPDAKPDQLCGIRNLSNYETERLDNEVPSSFSDQTATSHVKKLDRKVVAFL